MRTLLRRAFAVALVLVAGFTSWLIIANHASVAPPAPAPVSDRSPDYTLRDAVVTRYDPKGARRYVLRAQSIAHLPASGASVFGQPRLDYVAGPGNAWRVTAERGRLGSDNHLLLLRGKVYGRQLQGDNPLRITTAAAMVQLDRRIVRSRSPVRLWREGFQTDGIGLDADLTSGVVKLLAEVRSRYAP
ncbi:MAG TPA: LPS export ABC transporter periplasmic protein LptC [Gammaproteobacteria bacterium]|nr:LPS export ABC transporter periplasmic protein LptC [Gammaproteobacteria bacterium]